jgi:hypothetical protein
VTTKVTKERKKGKGLRKGNLGGIGERKKRRRGRRRGGHAGSFVPPSINSSYSPQVGWSMSRMRALCLDARDREEAASRLESDRARGKREEAPPPRLEVQPDSERQQWKNWV